jgi:hypothetical protein
VKDSAFVPNEAGADRARLDGRFPSQRNEFQIQQEGNPNPTQQKPSPAQQKQRDSSAVNRDFSMT